MDERGIHYSIRIDTDRLMDDAARSRKAFDAIGRSAEENGSVIDTAMRRAAKSLSLLGAGFTAKELVTQVATVRGEFQKLEVAFSTMLGSKAKADALMAQMVETAATTPFSLQDVAGGAKQLLAYGTAAEDVNETLVRLGDIAAGLSVPLNDLVYLYGTTMTQGRLYTADLNQFTGRGIPMIRELAKQFGVAESEVKKLVEEGKVGFPEVEKVIRSLTDSGGMFGGLMEAQSKTIAGQIANIEDSISTMFNNIGKSSEGIINTTLSGVSYLVENYDKVGEAVMAAATAYGSYRAILMTVTAVQRMNMAVLRQAVAEKAAATAASVTLSNAESVSAARTKLLALAQQGLVKALRATAAATIDNPYVLAAAAITGLVYAIYKYATAATAAESAQEAFNKSMDKMAKQAEDFKQKVSELVRTIQSAESTDLQKALAFDELKRVSPALTETYNTIDALSKADLSDINRSMNEMSDENRVKGLEAQAESLRELVRELDNAAASPRSSMSGSADVSDLVARAKAATGQEGSAFWDMAEWAKAAQEQLNRVAAELNRIDEARKGMEKPTELDVRLAQSAYDDTRRKFVLLSDFAAAMKREAENPMHPIVDGTEAMRGTDDIIKEIEDKLKSMEGIPLSVEQQKAKDDLQQILDYMRQWKADGMTQGTFTIPLYFQAQMDSAETATEEAKKQFNYITGEWEKLQQQPQTYKEALAQARKEWREAAKEYERLRTSDTSTKEEVSKAKTTLDEKEKAYKDLGGVTGSSLAKQQRDARKEAEERKKTQEELAEELLELRRRNQQDEIALMEEGREKKLAQIRQEYEEELAEIDRMEKEWAEKQGGETTVEQRVVLSQARTNAKDKRDQSISDLEEEEAKKRKERLEEEQKAMDEYLQKYGTYGEKVAATMRLFRTAMNADGVTEGEKLDLQKQMEEALQEIDFEKLKGEINWSAVFGNISAYTKKELEKVKAQLDTFKASDEYKGFSPENKEAVENALSEIQSAIDEKGGIFDAVISSMERYKEACEELTAAQNEYNEALASGDEEAIEAARTKVNQAERKKSDAGADVNEAKGNVQNKLIGVANAIAQLGSSSEMSLSSIGSLAESVSSMFGELGGKIGGWIGAAFSVLDVIGKEGVEGFTKNLNESLGSALTSLLEFGTFNLIDFGGLSNRDVDNQLADLEASNESLVQALDRLSDKMEEADVADKSGVYERQMANLQAQMRNTQQQMQLAGDVHDDGFLGMGGSHSSNYKVDKGMTAADWREVSEAVGRTVDSAAGFWTLSSEEMARVADEATVQYDKIKQLADDGTRDAAQYMDTYITYYEQMEEAQEAYYESLTNVSFDTVRDNFKDALKNMKDDAEAFSEDLEDMLQNAVLEALMDRYEPALEEWYKKLGEYIKDGTLDQWEADDLRKDYEAIVDEARKEYQATSDVLGFGKEEDGTTPAQQASSAVKVNASQESIDEANGRMLAIQETELQIYYAVQQQAAKIDIGNVNLDAIRRNSAESRDIIESCYAVLGEIRDNTGAVVEPIKRIDTGIQELKTIMKEGLL